MAKKWPDGRGESGAFLEVADRELDLRVAAVFGLDQGERLGAVGDEGVVAPVGEELCLRADQPGAADDQPTSASGASAISAIPSGG